MHSSVKPWQLKTACFVVTVVAACIAPLKMQGQDAYLDSLKKQVTFTRESIAIPKGWQSIGVRNVMRDTPGGAISPNGKDDTVFIHWRTKSGQDKPQDRLQRLKEKIYNGIVLPNGETAECKDWYSNGALLSSCLAKGTVPSTPTEWWMFRDSGAAIDWVRILTRLMQKRITQICLRRKSFGRR